MKKKIAIVLVVLILATALYAADVKWSAMPANTTIAVDDVLLLIDTGTGDSEKITALDVFDMIDTFAELQAITADLTLVNEEAAWTFDDIITFSTAITFSDAATIDQSANNYIDFAENADTIKFYYDATDLGILWSDGALNLQNAEDVDAIVNIMGKDAGEKGILRVLSDGDDKYIELYNDDTDAVLTNSAGNIIINPVGLGIVVGDNGDEDYTITFDGDTSNGILNYDEDNADFEFDQDVSTGGTFTATTSVITPVLDAAGAEDMDYGSIDVTDHTFTTDDMTLIIDGGITVSTGDFIKIGTTQWNSADEIDGTKIKDADYGDIDVSAGGAWTLDTDVVSTAEMADADHGDFTYSGGSATLDTGVVADNEIDYTAVTGADLTLTDAGAITSTGTITATVGFDIVGAADIDYGSLDVLDHTFVTDGTGDAEIVLPNDSIGDAEIDWTGLTTSADFTVTGTLITSVGIDGVGAIDLDYGSIDITDHTFVTDGTGNTEIVLPNDSIGDAELDWGNFTDLAAGGEVTWGNITAGELADDTVNDNDINWGDIANLAAGGAVTLAATVTVSDDEATDDDQEVVFTTDNATLESDGDFHYSPDTGTVTATEFVGGGTGITGLGATYATLALDNLAAVLINTSLISDTAATDDLGTEALYWRKLYNGTEISFEGGTDDNFQTTLSVTDPTADNAVVLRDAGGTVLLSGDALTGDVTVTFEADGSTVAAIGAAVVTEADLNATNDPGAGEDNYLLSYNHAGTNFTWVAAGAGAGDLLADGTVPMTADWDIGNFDITLKSLTGDGTIEGATITEGGNAVWNATETDFLTNEHVSWGDFANLGEEGTIIVADSTYASCYPALFQAATGNLASYTDAGLTYDATSGTLSATILTEGATGVYNITQSDAAYEATVTEGSLTDSVIISADIKDGEVTEVDLNATNAPGAGEDNYVLTYNHAGTNFTWAADADSGGATAWDDITDPDIAATIDFVTYTQTIDIGKSDSGGGSGLILDVTGLGAGTDDVIALEITTATNDDTDYIPIAIYDDSGLDNDEIFKLDNKGKMTWQYGAYIDPTAADNYIKFGDSSDEIKFYFDATDCDIIWTDGILHFRNDENGVDGIVQFSGQGPGEKGIVRVMSDGNDKYIELYNDDTDAVITNSAGNIIINPVGLGIVIGDNGDEDYTITFDGDTSDGILNYDEDNADFEFNQDVASTGNVEGATLTEGGVAIINATQGGAWTGDHNFGGADLELPQGQTPDTDGDIDLDFTDGSVVIQHGAAHAELGAATDVVVGKLIDSFAATIFAPDGVNDVIPLKMIDDLEFPHGIVIVECLLQVGTDVNYTLTLQNYDDFDTINGVNGTIDAIAYTSDTTGEVTDTTITYGTIGAGQIIMMSIPATDVDWMHIEVFYYEPIA